MIDPGVAELQKQLGSLASELKGPHPSASARLIALSTALGPTADVDAWATSPPLVSLDAEWVAGPLRHDSGDDRSIARLERLRNILILLPILVTWLGLMYASVGYRQAVQGDPSLASSPLLLLWETGFGGYARLPFGLDRFLNLGTVALLDVALIALLVLLSWRLHSKVNVVQARRDEYADTVAERVADLTWRATQALAPRLSPRTTANQLEVASSALLDELRAERERIGELAAERERHTADLRAGARDLRAATTALVGIGVAMKAASEAIATSVGSVERQLHAIESQPKAIASLSSDLATYSQALADVGQMVAGASGALAGAATASQSAADQLAVSTGSVGAELAGLTSFLQAERAAILAGTSTATSLAEAIDRWTVKAGVARDVLADDVVRVEALVGPLTTALTQLNLSTDAQRKHSTELVAVAQGISTLTAQVAAQQAVLISEMQGIARSLNAAASAPQPARPWPEVPAAPTAAPATSDVDDPGDRRTGISRIWGR